MQRFGLTLYSLLLATSSLAQQPAADTALLTEEEPEIRRYTVELIVFRYAEEVSVGTEIFQPDIIEVIPVDPFAEPDALDTDPSVAEPGTDAEINTELDDLLFEMVLLTEDDLTLTSTWDRLDRLDAYEPLLHIGWTQTALPAEVTPALDLREFGEPPADLNGSFTLYLSRFLHLVVDLELDAPDAALAYGRATPRFDAPPRRFGDARESREYGNGYLHDEPQYDPLRFRIDEDRLFKNGETRYFDHPKFGVVAKVLRYEEPEVEEEPDDTAFLSPAVVGD